MKSVLLASILSLSVSVVLGQDSTSAETTTYPIWTISKAVQKIQFRNSVFKNARVYSGNAWILTKDVHRLQLVRRARLRTHVIKLGNTPSSIISKGVARMQYENK